MPAPVYSLETSRFDSQTLGGRYREQYVAGEPYPHIMFDDFLEPSCLDAVLEDLGGGDPAVETNHNRAQERLKTSFNPDELPPRIRDLFRTFNAQPFVSFLEKMTGISGLISDSTFFGGGIHRVSNGGHLSVHADFNLHPSLKLERRINVLIYLNRDWEASYGGQFEIWDQSMSRKVKSFDPLFNRCVVFNTTSNSYHGNPNPVAHPLGSARQSIALYYYTATWDPSRRQHTTHFKARPGTLDQIDWRERCRETVRDLAPPLILRAGKRAIAALRDGLESKR